MKNIQYRLKVLIALLLSMHCFSTFAVAPTVTSVTAQQRYPWNGLVDIAVTFNGEQGDVAKANCVFAATNSATKAALTIAHVTPQGGATGSGTAWTRRFVWDTNADLGEVKIDDVELSADVEAVAEEPEDLGGVQLWEDGPYWAECNVGATKPEECGLYFWWGDTDGHKGGAFSFTKENCPTFDKGESVLRSLGYTDSTGDLNGLHDAARMQLGAPWRMPTAAEFNALISNCSATWTTRNGVWGRRMTGTGAYAKNSIFLPAGGCCYNNKWAVSDSEAYYWSSSPDEEDEGSDGAWALRFFSFGSMHLLSVNRNYGLSLRPVRGLAQ